MTAPARLSLSVVLINETRDSIQVKLAGDDGAGVFLPISQIDIAPERQGRMLLVTLPRWLAESKGLISKPDPNQGVLF
ncbi:hypothetical protein [Devosia sp. 2618]|uniref:hypothetical protein n=1 Tax=Devosia sp. 2618 TaxID=3156454 RepID=UPI003392460C